jgi:hypothetical protein
MLGWLTGVWAKIKIIYVMTYRYEKCVYNPHYSKHSSTHSREIKLYAIPPSGEGSGSPWLAHFHRRVCCWHVFALPNQVHEIG